MFATGAIMAFLVWIGVGVALNRKSAALRRRIQNYGVAARLGLCVGAYLLSIVALGGTFATIVALNSWPKSGPTPTAWALIALGGAAFTALQTIGTACIVLFALDGRQNDRAAQTSSPRN